MPQKCIIVKWHNLNLKATTELFVLLLHNLCHPFKTCTPLPTHTHTPPHHCEAIIGFKRKSFSFSELFWRKPTQGGFWCLNIHFLLTYLQYSTIQYSTVQYSTVQYRQYSTVQYTLSPSLQSPAPHSLLYYTVLKECDRKRVFVIVLFIIGPHKEPSTGYSRKKADSGFRIRHSCDFTS